MKKQRGVTISGLLFWAVPLVLGAILFARLVPEYLDYYKIVKSVKTVASSSSAQTVSEIKADYEKFASVDGIKSISSADLDISKEGNQVVIAFAYERRVHLFANVSLLLEFEGSSAR